jgi:cytochrome c553
MDRMPVGGAVRLLLANTSKEEHTMNRAALFISAVALSAGFGQSGDAADKTAELASRTCETCHGPKGDSTSSAFPRLAGQRAEYIETQLRAFRAQTRGDPPAQAYMWTIASRLEDQDIRDLARYYASQMPAAGAAGDTELLREGKNIYESGVPKEKVFTCISCHGEYAEGKDKVPRLAGQHAPYLVKQLVYFQSSQRGGEVHIMRAAIGERMTLQQMEAVAAYLASL